MTRRGRTVPSLTVRVSHEATRLSQTHVAAAFEQLVPVLERQIRPPLAEAGKHDVDAARRGTNPVTDPIAKRYVTNSAVPRTGVRSR